ncbi:MAG: UDP-4-amino-4,6-dideoxy-N-acetyl-beta-L-altrosamine transaminase [Candidatus Omnitrophica bacterium]|nr:UDP-4-amino-4,6-dideoxy-N-acetyl-beta-L-altrosamine transaminase [Candidatus Omnitrophota bacterium]
MKKKKLLITGISGLLGSNLAYVLKNRYEILGWYHDHPISVVGVSVRRVNVLDKNLLKTSLVEFQPDIIIHCAAQANVDACEENPRLAESLNVQGTKNLIESVASLPIKVIHISTDLVYSGKKGRYKETDALQPVNYYGKTKVSAEIIVSKFPRSVILRTNFFGWNVREDKHSLAEWAIEEISHHRPILGFKDVYFSSLYTFDLAEIVHKIIARDLQGVFNCGSSTAVSKYNFVKAIARKTGLATLYIKPVFVDAVGLPAKRGKNLSLNVAKLSKGLGLKLPTIEETMNRFIKDYKRRVYDQVRSWQAKVYYPTMETIPYGRQNLDEDDIEAVVAVMKTGNLTQGPKIPEFENALCQVTDASFAVAVNSATSGLHIACLSAGVGPGDEVITSANTFVASANCAVYCGGKPVFADIDPRTYNISPEEVERKISPRTKAVIPVHFAGQSCDMETIKEIVNRAEKKFGHKIFIIEDASHALGSKFKDTKVGSCAYSDMVVLSFHPVKHITTGEGGAVLTKDKGLLRKLQFLRSHGITSTSEEFEYEENAFDPLLKGEKSPQQRYWYYEQQHLGFNYRITDLQCALGCSQIKKLDAFRKRRKEIVDFYNTAFKNIQHIVTPYAADDCDTNFHLYVLLFDFEKIGLTRAQMMQHLRDNKIYTQVHYIPVYTQPFYRNTFGSRWGDCVEMERYYKKCLSIPLYPAMTESDVQTVFRAIQTIMGSPRGVKV